MGDWQAMARKFFPEMGARLDGDPRYSLYQLFFDLVPMARRAHAERDEGVLRRIYALASWAARQGPESLWQAAAMAFYEHLADHEETRAAIPETVPKAALLRLWPLWTARLEAADAQALQRILLERAQWEPMPPAG